MIVAGVMAKKRGYVSKEKYNARLILKTLWQGIPSLLLIVIVIGGILGGVFTATEGSAIAVVYSLLLSFIYRSIKVKDLPKILLASVKTTAVVEFLVCVSAIMSWVMSFAKIPQMISDAMLGISNSPIIILLIMNVILLLVGTFMDPTPAVLIFTPIFLPIVQSLSLIHISACPKCGDTGWRGAEMCECLKTLCTEEQIRGLSRLLDLGGQSFDAFQLEYYSPLPCPGRNATPRKNMELVYEICLNYAQKFGRFPVRNLFLSGPPGLGKTFLSACIAREVSENGFSVVYDTAVNIFAQYEAQRFSRDIDDSREARDETRRYRVCDLLILDDLGSEMTSPLIQSALYTLINTRLTAEKRTVISSNLSIEDVRRRYSPQIASRLEGEYRVLPFFGDDIRLLKKQKI